MQAHGIKAYLYFIREYPAKTLIVVLCLMVAAAAELLGIGMLLPLLNEITGSAGGSGKDSEILSLLPFSPTLTNLLIVLVAAIVLKSSVLYFSLRYAGIVSAKITYDFRKKLVKALMNARWPYYAGQPVGRFANALAEEATRAGGGYMLSCKAMVCLIMIATYLSASMTISWQVCLVALLIGGGLAFSLKAIVRKARQAGYDITEAMQVLLNRMIAALDGVKAVKAMRREDSFTIMIYKELQKSYSAQTSHVIAAQMAQNIYEPITVLAIAAGLYWITTYTDITTASALVMAFLFYRLMGQFNLLQNHYQNMVQAESAVWSVLKIIDEAESAKETFGNGKKPELHTAITFDNVTFAHKGQDHFLFDKLTLSIQSNRLNVVFAPSGKGKTTLIDMILGFYVPKGGSIALDGTPLSDINTAKWREKIGYVPQDTYLFNESIKHNITFGEEGASNDKVYDALRLAAADAFVDQLPGKLDFVVGEKGSLLSGGQKQRISIARALYREPALLIMDEATTGLDAQNETAIMDALSRIKENTTIILITHNQALLKRADNVISLS